jgi:hypothetical protein
MRHFAVLTRDADVKNFKQRDGIYHLAAFAKPDGSPAEIVACVNVVLACLIGLCYRPVLNTTNAETSCNVACLMMRALRLPDQPLI